MLKRETYPKKNIGNTIELSNGKKLGYHIHGKTENYHTTILLFSGTPGSRLFFFYEKHLSLTINCNIRVISIDYPGIGFSDYDENFTFKSIANDVFQLIEKLSIEEYHIIGYSAGGIPASCFACLHSNKAKPKLKSLSLISSVGPHDTPNVYSDMVFVNKLAWYLVLKHQKLSAWAFKEELHKEHQKPIECLVETYVQMGGLDEEKIKDSSILRALLISSYEVQASENGNNCTLKIGLSFGKPWDVVLKDIRCPVVFYSGTQDHCCGPAMSAYMYQSICGKQANAPDTNLNNTDNNTNNVNNEEKKIENRRNKK